MNNKIETPKDFSGSLKKLYFYNKKLIPLILVAIILSMTSTILAIIGPDKLKQITNIIVEGLASKIDLGHIKSIALFLLIIYIISLVFDYIQGVIMTIVTNKFSYRMRGEISSKINRLPLSYFDKTLVGDILSRVTNDVDTISMSLNQSISTLVSATTMFIGTMFMMFYTNSILAIVAILSTVFGFAIMAFIMKKSQKYFNAFQNKLGEINGHIEETFSGQSIVKVYNAYDESLNKFDKINDELFENTVKSQFYSGLMHPIMNFIGNFGYVCVCIVGAYLTMNNVISFGVIVAFMIYVRLFTNPLTQFAQSFTSLQSTAAAAEREVSEPPVESAE